MEVDTETPEEDAAVAIVNDLLKQAAKIQQKHDLIVLRETTTRVAQARANFFASASRRQLRGEVLVLYYFFVLLH